MKLPIFLACLVLLQAVAANKVKIAIYEPILGDDSRKDSLKDQIESSTAWPNIFEVVFVGTNDIDSAQEITDNYDVILLSSTGNSGEFNNLAVANAISSFVKAGGGIVTVGWTIGASDFRRDYITQPVVDILNEIMPVPLGYYSWTRSNETEPVTFYNSSSTWHPMMRDVQIASLATPTSSSKTTHAFIECARKNNSEITGTPLIGMDGPFIENPCATDFAFAYSEPNNGRSVYIGAPFGAEPSSFYKTDFVSDDTEWDLVLENALAWAADPKLYDPFTVSLREFATPFANGAHGCIWPYSHEIAEVNVSTLIYGNFPTCSITVKTIDVSYQSCTYQKLTGASELDEFTMIANLDTCGDSFSSYQTYFTPTVTVQGIGYLSRGTNLLPKIDTYDNYLVFKIIMNWEVSGCGDPTGSTTAYFFSPNGHWVWPDQLRDQCY